MRRPYRREELDRLIPRLDRQIAATEADWPDARPLPPMTILECLDYGRRLMDIAGERALTPEECFLHGQIPAVLVSAARAEALGYRGRYLVISEEDIATIVEREGLA